MDAEETEADRRLNAVCDECGPAVASRVMISLPSGGILSYCLHHTNEHRERLYAIGALLVPLGGAEL